jgi:hypothetical protein
VNLVPTRFRNSRTIARALHEQRWLQDITGVLNEDAVAELDSIWDAVESIRLSPDVSDHFIWRWSPDGQFSAASAYQAFHAGSMPFEGAKLLWKTWAPLRVKLFLWLAFRRRVWTADRRIRHGLDTGRTCKLCEDETCDHILFRCSYSLQVWWAILHNLSIARTTATTGMNLPRWWNSLHVQLPPSKRKGFDTLFSLLFGTFGKNETPVSSATFCYSRPRCLARCVRKEKPGLLRGLHSWVVLLVCNRPFFLFYRIQLSLSLWILTSKTRVV